MNFIYNILIIIFLTFNKSVFSELHGKYCGNIFGNEINITAIDNNSNISANVFGEQLNCRNEKFILNNNTLLFTKNESDCLNKNLKDLGACPCPPNVIYDLKANKLEILDTPVGTIFLNNCI